MQQPVWGDDGTLYFISDRGAGWWNLYEISASDLDPVNADVAGRAAPICPMAAEFGLPPWTLGLRSYAPLPRAACGGRRLLLAAYSDPAAPGAALGVVDAGARALSVARLDCGLSAARGGWGVSVAPGRRAAAGGGKAGDAGGGGERDTGFTVVVAAGSPARAQGIMMLQVANADALAASKPSDWVELRAGAGAAAAPPAGYVSAPEAVEFPTAGGRTAFLNFYPPRNARFRLPAGELPPLLVKIHGGEMASIWGAAVLCRLPGAAPAV